MLNMGTTSKTKKEFFNRLKTTIINCWEIVGRNVKNAFSKYKNTMPHYGVRAIFALLASIYFIYLAKCFLTIPIKDYYFDIYSVSPDSVTAEIDLTIGSKNIFNTYYNSHDLEYDSIHIQTNCFKYTINKKYKLYPDQKELSHAIDSIYVLSKTDSNYLCLLRTYQRNKHYDNLSRDTLSSYVYIHSYLNVETSEPIGFVRGDTNVITPINMDSIPKEKFLDKKGVYVGGGFNNTFTSEMNLSILKDSTSYKKLSPYHGYYNMGNITRYSSLSEINIENANLSGDLGFRQSQPNHFAYKLYPKLLYILLKEDISQAYYRFTVNSRSISSYIINVHSSAGAIINNNPSDELKVLTLHDTRITKDRIIAGQWNEDFNDTDLFVSFPENDNIQYFRLFFVTLIIGWLLLAVLKNICNAISNKRF